MVGAYLDVIRSYKLLENAKYIFLIDKDDIKGNSLTIKEVRFSFIGVE